MPETRQTSTSTRDDSQDRLSSVPAAVGDLDQEARKFFPGQSQAANLFRHAKVPEIQKYGDPLEFLQQVAADLRWVASKPQEYTLDMDFWHNGQGSVCSVCVAGAWLAHTCNTLPTVRIEVYMLPPELATLVSFVDSLRSGLFYTPDDIGAAELAIQDVGWDTKWVQIIRQAVGRAPDLKSGDPDAWEAFVEILKEEHEASVSEHE